MQTERLLYLRKKIEAHCGNRTIKGIFEYGRSDGVREREREKEGENREQVIRDWVID